MENELDQFKRKILEKKELRGIPSDFLDDFLKKYRRAKFLDVIPDRVLDIVRGIKKEIMGR